MTIFARLRGLKLSVPLLIASVFVCGMTAYALFFDDPYVVLFMAPFFLLGCARGRHPLVLLALSTIPAIVVLLISTAKTLATGFSLVTYDGLFLRQNLLLLAYNDWRVASVLIFLIFGFVFYVRSLLAGRGRVTRAERRLVGFLSLTSIGCIFAVQQWDGDILDWQYELSHPSIRALVKSVRLPELRLAVPAKSSEMPRFENLSIAAPEAAIPDLFFILQESTFHPRLVEAGYEPINLYSSQADHSGNLHVHTYGGGTWMTEFAFLTQISPNAFGNGGHYVFHQLAGHIKRSVFTLLKEQGYRTIVIYPVDGNFINAKRFYTSIGVDEFYDPESLNLGKGWQWQIPDKDLYGAIQNKLEESDRPTAVMMLTINQHGPHDTLDPVKDYLGRFEQSDAAYGEFLNYLSSRDKRSGVVAFGDHHPFFTSTLMENESLKYLTAYDIRCVNFSCADKPFSKNDRKNLDVTFLAPFALKQFGFRLDDLSIAQQNLLGVCDGDISECEEKDRLAFNGVFSHFVQ